VVAVAGTPRRPEIFDRRRIQLSDPADRFPYHAAQPLPLERAKELLARCEAETSQLALIAVDQLVTDLEKRGYALEACGMVSGASRALPELATILASHALLHTAEGVHFREAVVRAIERRGLPALRVAERGLLEQAAGRFHTQPPKLQASLTEAGRALGPPWTADQKLAALVAWLALAQPADSRATLTT
jgi:hypothetical protein